MLYVTHDRDEAFSLAKKAKERLPNDPHVSDTLGWIYYKKGVFKRAAALIREAVEKEPDHHPVVYSPSWLNREKGEFSPPPNFMVDTKPWFDIKIQAINCHRSQHDMFLRHGSARMDRPVTLPEMIRTREALSRIYPDEPGIPDDSLAELLTEISIPIQSSYYE